MKKHYTSRSKVLLLFLVLAVAGAAEAQTHEFAPIGAEWYYNYQMNWIEGYVKITSEADTVINGFHFKKLAKSRHVYNYVEEMNHDHVIGYEFVLQQGDSVMVFRNGHIYKLFDFGAGIGDSWEIPQTYLACPDSVGSVVVVGKGVEEMFGLNLRYIDINDVSGSSWGYGFHGDVPCRVYDRVGPVNGYLFPEQLCLIDVCEGGALRCYHDDEVMAQIGDVDCDYVYLSLSERSDNCTITVFPNPARDYVQITLPAFEAPFVIIDVFDALGRQFEKMKVIEGASYLDISHYPTGLYSLSARSNSNTYHGFFVKL
ncbi:T9SS type A sorting domain-containing protein [Bacteroides heparinolyticus]|uniref:T9SS type A sorting domain-containing protein n=2 Tax=Prevotella heparinolytica TaxID=28113 RepID=UPI0035A17A22